MILANRHSRRLFGSTIVAKTFTVIVVVIIITGFCDNKKAFTFNVSGNIYLRISPLKKITAPLVTGVPGVVTSESHVGVLFSRQPSGGLFSPLYRRSHPIFWPPVILISSQLRGGHHRIWLYLIIFTVIFRFSSINNCSTTVAEIRLLRLFENYSMYPKLCHVSKASSIFILTQLQCSEPYGLALICYERPLSQLPNNKFSQRWEILRILFLENIFPK